MIEPSEYFRGNLIKLSDEPVQDFVNGVASARDAYRPVKLSPDGLEAHATELRQLTRDLGFNLVEGNPSTVSDHKLWIAMVDLGLEDKELGEKFLRHYSYMRVNRYLGTEFGPAETDTTIVLRGIVNQVVLRKLKTKDADTIREFMNVSFPGVVTNAIYSSRGDSDVHTALADHLEESRGLRPPYFDPALARVISTLLFRDSPVVDDLPEDVRTGLLMTSRSIFVDRGVFSPGSKPKTIDWGDRVKGQELEPESVESETDKPEAEGLSLPTTNTVGELDFRKGKCHVDKVVGMSEVEHETLVNAMIDKMFPSNGVGAERAKRFCGDCQIKEDCKEYAIANKLDHGVWGATSERERRDERQKRQRAAKAPAVSA